VVILIVLDEGSGLDVFPLGEKGEYLQHGVAPGVAEVREAGAVGDAPWSWCAVGGLGSWAA
jgi:hypothetical protein